jgi:hypothetical protein
MMTLRGSISPVSLAILSAVGFLVACGSERVAAPSSSLTPSAAAASHGGKSNGSGSDDPHFLTADSTAPYMANPVIAFWAKKGVDTTVYMYYHASPGYYDSTAFMQFRVRAKSLLSRPDGSLIANGDSVLITITLTDPTTLALDFQPSGLKFSSHDQPELRLSFGECAPISSTNEQSLRIWRKESLLDPWLPLSSNVSGGSDEVQASISGFTGYALAY